MVNFLRFKNSKTKIKMLKNRKLDFFRINPFAIMKIGKKRLIKSGLLHKGEQIPTDNPNRFITHSLITHWAPTRFDDNNIHIGFTVAVKSVSKKANKRNLVKRRLRAIINENIRNYKIRGYDFVFTARSSILDTPFDELQNELHRTFKFIEHQIKNQKKN